MLFDSIGPVVEFLELESVLSNPAAALSAQFLEYSKSFVVISLIFTRSTCNLRKHFHCSSVQVSSWDCSPSVPSLGSAPDSTSPALSICSDFLPWSLESSVCKKRNIHKAQYKVRLIINTQIFKCHSFHIFASNTFKNILPQERTNITDKTEAIPIPSSPSLEISSIFLLLCDPSHYFCTLTTYREAQKYYVGILNCLYTWYNNIHIPLQFSFISFNIHIMFWKFIHNYTYIY